MRWPCLVACAIAIGAGASVDWPSLEGHWTLSDSQGNAEGLYVSLVVSTAEGTATFSCLSGPEPQAEPADVCGWRTAVIEITGGAPSALPVTIDGTQRGTVALNLTDTANCGAMQDAPL